MIHIPAFDNEEEFLQHLRVMKIQEQSKHQILSTSDLYGWSEKLSQFSKKEEENFWFVAEKYQIFKTLK